MSYGIFINTEQQIIDLSAAVLLPSLRCGPWSAIDGDREPSDGQTLFINSPCLLFSQTIKLKAEARLDLLRQVGVSVDTWLKSAMNQVCMCENKLEALSLFMSQACLCLCVCV